MGRLVANSIQGSRGASDQGAANSLACRPGVERLFLTAAGQELGECRGIGALGERDDGKGWTWEVGGVYQEEEILGPGRTDGGDPT